MAKEGKTMVVPQLRFPEFKKSEWTSVELSRLASFVMERVGTTECIPYTVTSGEGLISQQEKLGRTIAGNSIKNYIVLQNGDFAYNKSATKAFPQGFIARYTGIDRAAVPNSIFTCFRVDSGIVEPAYLDYLFSSNLHGKWLRRRITVGARAHGSLNVSDDDLMALPVPLPEGSESLDEQQKIVDCLSSLDELIVAQRRKVDALKTYKRGLMQQLFPRKGETVPRFRFPEFRDAPEWKEAPIGELFDTSSGGTPDRAKREYWNGDIPWVTTSLVDFNFITKANEFISYAGLENSSAKIFPKGTVLIAMYGQGKTRGKVAVLGIPAATNQACAAILPNDEIDHRFTFVSLCGRYEEMRKLSNSGGQENLSQALVRRLPFRYPNDVEEQSRIVECFSELDVLIVGEVEKLNGLETHKKGFMQLLFPSLEGK
jgi:type I restriction enzyme S subunit